jgi:hypothetical protein
VSGDAVVVCPVRGVAESSPAATSLVSAAQVNNNTNRVTEKEHKQSNKQKGSTVAPLNFLIDNRQNVAYLQHEQRSLTLHMIEP